MVGNRTIPKEVASHSFVYEYAKKRAVLTVNEPAYTKLYKALVESLSTKRSGVKTTFKAWQPLPEACSDKILLRLYGPLDAFFDGTWKPDDFVRTA